jgi:hypothetical protein
MGKKDHPLITFFRTPGNDIPALLARQHPFLDR